MKATEKLERLSPDKIKRLSGEEVVEALRKRRSLFILLIHGGHGASVEAVDLAEDIDLLNQYIVEAIDFYSLAETESWECQCGAKGEVTHVGLSPYELKHRIVWQHREMAPDCPGYLARKPLAAAIAQA